MTSILLTLEPLSVRCDADSSVEVPCTGCDDLLVIHQPDEGSPNRLLGTCPECQAWFLINVDEKVMVRLPDEDAVHGT